MYYFIFSTYTKYGIIVQYINTKAQRIIVYNCTVQMHFVILVWYKYAVLEYYNCSVQCTMLFIIV